MNRQQLIEDNMRLVYYIINKEYPTYSYDEDIIQSGMLGLCKAANAWKGEGAFSTYAGKAIRNEIRAEFIRRKPHSKNISLDSRISDDSTLMDVIIGEDDVTVLDDESFYCQLNKTEREILGMHHNGYSPDEIAVVMSYTVQKVQKILRLIRLKWRNFNGDSNKISR